MWHSFFQLCVGRCDHFLAGCGCVWVFVTFFWLGIGGFGWMWPFFGWVWVSVTFFLAGCGWVWVGVGDCTVYNYLKIRNKSMICMTMHTIMLIVQWRNITGSILESKGMCGFGWVWVGVGDCTVYNYLKIRNKSMICMTMHTIMLILQWRNKTGSILERKGMCGIFQKKRAKKKKGEILENLGKNVQSLKIFWKKASDCVWLLHAINC